MELLIIFALSLNPKRKRAESKINLKMTN